MIKKDFIKFMNNEVNSSHEIIRNKRKLRILKFERKHAFVILSQKDTEKNRFIYNMKKKLIIDQENKIKKLENEKQFQNR